MKIVNKTEGNITTYNKINNGDVFKFENSICIAIDEELILMHNQVVDMWNIENAPSEDDEIVLLDCELVIKGSK